MKTNFSSKRGFSLLEAIFGIALISLIFWGLYGSFQASLQLVSNTKAQTTAISLANDQIESIKSLSYENIGTVGGIPAGLIATSSTEMINNVTFTKTVSIKYIDDPKDGTIASSTDSISTDYKQVTTEVMWEIRAGARSIKSISNISPPGVETDAEGDGAILINVIDATGMSVSGALVHVVNDTTVPAIDADYSTDVNGQILVPGSPAASDYEITITKSGYSTASTYDADTPNPIPPHIAVSEGSLTTATFIIDQLATLNVDSWIQILAGFFNDPFSDSSKTDVFTNMAIVGGKAKLIFNVIDSCYETPGEVQSTIIAPSFLNAWEELRLQITIPGSTTLKVHVLYEDGGTWTLIPDADLPGNGAGFSATPVDLSGLDDIATYPALRIQGKLTSSSCTASPDINSWRVSYLVGPTPLGAVGFDVHGDKQIGTTASSTAIYKFEESLVTDSNGNFSTSTIEWDNYTFGPGTVAGYVVESICGPQPVSVSPNASTTVDIFYVAATTPNPLRTTVIDNITGDPIEGATVDIQCTGSCTDPAVPQLTNSCGQVLIQGIATGNGYEADISATGYVSETLIDIDIPLFTEIGTELNPS